MSSTSSTSSTSVVYNINNKFPLLFSSSSKYNTLAASLSSLDDVLPQLAIKSSPMMADIKREVAEVASGNKHYQSLKATLCMFEAKKRLPSSPSATTNIIVTWDLHVINMEEEQEGITTLTSLTTLSAAKKACPTPTTSTDSILSLIPESSTDKDNNSHPGDGWQPYDDEDFFVPYGNSLRQANYIFYNLRDRKNPLISATLGSGHPSHTHLLHPRPAPYHIPFLTTKQACVFNEYEPFNTWVNQAVIDLGDPSLLAGIEAYQGWEKEVKVTEEKVALL
ncbi:hypothetical protein BJV74DRAFT_890727 [Russula compacta]|nr:hypothetical protein BJV74DRAFT_890727 [Russula compacta]